MHKFHNNGKLHQKICIKCHKYYNDIYLYSNINDTIGGILTLGSSDSKLYEGELHYAPVESNDTWWRVRMDR